MEFDGLLYFLLPILILGKKPVITHGVTETYGYENQPASLQCRVKSETSVVIEWYKNGSKISKWLEYRVEITQLSDDILKCDLVFLISRGTVGAYYCNASNEFGWAVSSSASVFIAFMEDKFMAEPQSKTAYIGETVTLACEPPSGSPKPTITWYKDEIEVDFSNRVQIFDRNKLRIEQISLNDSGDYFCVARSLGFVKTSKKAYLRVLQRPVFLVAPQSQTIPVNGAVEFVCRVSGEPPPTLTWRRHPAAPVISTTRSMLLADGSLKLMNIQLEDSGVYVCQARNDGGVVEATAHLTVTSPPGFIATPPGNAVFLEGTRAQLVCLATGSPIPEIRWINQETSEYYLYNIKSPFQRITVINSGSLVINNVRMSDSGSYECRASSPAGFTRTVVHLFVQPNPHLFPGRIGMATKSPEYTANSENKAEVKLICSPPSMSEFYEYMASGVGNISEIRKVGFFSTFKTSWYKEKMAIDMTSLNDQFRVDGEDSLIIKSVQKSNIGNYSCMIFNLLNKRIAFWQMRLLPVLLSERFNKPNPISVIGPPSNVSIISLGDTWITLSWDYDYEENIGSDIQFQIFYLLQFHNSTYVSSGGVRSFYSDQIMDDPIYQGYESQTDSNTTEDNQYPVDVWESASESTREKHFTLTGLLPDSGYWVEVRASDSYLWSKGALISHIVYTAQSTSTGHSSNFLQSRSGSSTEDFQDLSARVHSLIFLGVSARSLSTSELYVSWAVLTTNDAIKLVDGFKIVARPVFMSRCSARATSVVKDRANPFMFRANEQTSFSYGEMISTSNEQAHCSFNSEQLIEQFKQAFINGTRIPSGRRFAENVLIVSRFISKEFSNTGAVLGGLHPFTCYEVTVKAFKDDQTYGRIWSRETPSELVLTLDAAPSQAPELISANWLRSIPPQKMFHSSISFANFSNYSNAYAFSSGIRINWMPLDLHHAHGTLIGYSIHLVANDSNYTQSQIVRPLFFISLLTLNLFSIKWYIVQIVFVLLLKNNLILPIYK